MDLVRARARLGTDADDALALAHEVPHGRATLQLERREAARLGDEHLEHGRLRDDARAFDAEVADRDTQETAGAAVDLEPADVRLREASNRAPSPIWTNASTPLGMSASPRNSRAKSVWRSRSVIPIPRRASR